ncbi:MAG: hypothetical protein B7Z81_08020 [Acidocella sp. 20-61-6]|nr:MAG: hypothetical protein B7Z81_08020 [Acidocella sp. 20-61-6]
MKPILPSQTNFYTGGTLDRAANRREDAAWIDAAFHDGRSRFAPFWRGQALIHNNTPRAALVARPEVAASWVFLGLQDATPVFALDLSHFEEPLAVLPEGCAFADLRALNALLSVDDATILATARAMLHWRATHRFCPRCGGENHPVRGGYVLRCTQCATEHFPRSDPAVIMLVARGDSLLLGQSLKFAVERNLYSRVGAIAYHSSQPWPFPASLMLGFMAQGISEDIVLDTSEMRDARWFSRADILNHAALGFNLPPSDSIARRLIEDWLAA